MAQQHQPEPHQPTQQPSPDPLLLRFGTFTYYEESFQSLDFLHPRRTFLLLEEMKKKSLEHYEQARQRYLKLLGQHRMVWLPTNPTIDSLVEVSRIYRENEDDYIAFMRIRPKGFRGERVVTANMELNFHLLLGRAVFMYRRRPRNMHRGSHIAVGPRSTYAIRCLGEEPAYFVFQVLARKASSKTTGPEILAIEMPPTTSDKNL